jgi:uncharacterized protein
MSGTPDAEPLRSRLRRALPAAMKARDAAAVAALRSALAAIDNAEAIEGRPASASASMSTGGVIAGAAPGLGAGEAERLDLSERQIVDIVRAEVADRRSAAAGYERAGQPDRAARLTAEADTLAAHLADEVTPWRAGGGTARR